MKEYSQAHTRKIILPQYAEIINKWKTLAGAPLGIKILQGFWGAFLGSMLLYRGKNAYRVWEPVSKSIEFVDQWLFIGQTIQLANQQMPTPHILRRATGKFLPWSECEKFEMFNT